MNADERHRFVTMIDIAVRETTSPKERAAAVSRIMAIAEGKTVADVLKAEFTTEAEPTPPVQDVEQALRQLIKHHGIVRVRRVLGEIDAEDGMSSARERPWREWKAKHEETVAECERLRRRVTILESPRYEKWRPKPDADGNIPYPKFLFTLLAARNWYVQDALVEFADLAEVDQREVKNWPKRGKVSHYYYDMLDKLPFGERPRIEMTWDDVSTEMLRGYFSVNPVNPDVEIAKEMSQRLGRRVSQHAVHVKAGELGLLRNVRRVGRRLSAFRQNRDAAGKSQHTQS